ncbi:MAG: hypothetical protein Q9170_003488 [Blastenia crenularia]
MTASSPRPILPQFIIPHTDLPTFTPTTSPTTTPKANNFTTTSSPITAIITRTTSPGLPPLERQQPVPRFHGTRLSDYDTDDESAKSVLSWHLRAPRRGVLDHLPEATGQSFADILARECNEAWERNQTGKPRGDGAIWEDLAHRTVKGEKVWASKENSTMGRMDVQRPVRKSGSRSPLRFGVSAEELHSSAQPSGKRGDGYRASRFSEVYVDSRTGCECLCPRGERKWASTSTLRLSGEQEREYLRRAKEEMLMPGVEGTIGEEVVRKVADEMERCPSWKGDEWRRLKAECAGGVVELEAERGGKERKGSRWEKVRKWVKGLKK